MIICPSESQKTDETPLRFIPGSAAPNFEQKIPFAGYKVPVAIIRQYADDWISEAQYLQQSPKTIRSKQDSIDKFLWWCERANMTNLGKQEIRKFMGYLANGHLEPNGRWDNPLFRDPLSRRTCQSYFVNLRTMLKWFVLEEVIPCNPMDGLPMPTPEDDQIQPFSEDQIRMLFNAAKRLTNPERDVATLALLLDSGLRASEYCGLRWRDLDMNLNSGIATVLGKGNKIRSVPFGRDATRAIRKYVQKQPRDLNSPVFLSTRGRSGRGTPMTVDGLGRVFRRLEAASGITNVRCSPHTCRHTFAIKYLRRGGDVMCLKLILGHTKLKTTERYVALADADVVKQHRTASPIDGEKYF